MGPFCPRSAFNIPIFFTFIGAVNYLILRISAMFMEIRDSASLRNIDIRNLLTLCFGMYKRRMKKKTKCCTKGMAVVESGRVMPGQVSDDGGLVFAGKSTTP
ncbi:hypothetical protein PHJA_001756400 [Phtheirospermum japonicum]|uniref:Uncharacterized protein n=1 Tax=Phtheirospermum japonicum TaxID=374723 RepID=A0A830CK00_9LAMI|nr:hypothetical protein PHJA_001756400 [Phtheirospermum japonicum]